MQTCQIKGVLGKKPACTFTRGTHRPYEGRTEGLDLEKEVHGAPLISTQSYPTHAVQASLDPLDLSSPTIVQTKLRASLHGNLGPFGSTGFRHCHEYRSLVHEPRVVLL